MYSKSAVSVDLLEITPDTDPGVVWSYSHVRRKAYIRENVQVFRRLRYSLDLGDRPTDSNVNPLCGLGTCPEVSGSSS